ncbi:GNAT family N-acetyltransferase [Aquirufa sp. KTFRIE-69F]|uniref:GNAT family N-acetyltransferase n=1 Tax=Aquirufa originis TaxID=3096514 RepID=A0ABW6D6M3_9BACT
MILRKATLEDIPLIQEIAEEAWRPTYGHILTEEQTLYMIPMMYNTELISAQIHLFSILEVDGKAIGYCAFEKTSDKDGKLHKLYLRPSVKQKGAGSFIIAQISHQARLMGLTSIYLNVNKHNSAVEFYLKKGFIKDREMILDIGNGYVMDDYVMRLML